LYVLAVIGAFVRADPARRTAALRSVLYFGPVWIALGLAPTVAAGYESPRHAYLAAVGWAILIGLAFDLLRTSRSDAQSWSRVRTYAAAAATLAIVTLYGVRLHREVSDWRLRSAVSEIATRELERQVMSAPAGALFIVGVPAASWEWAAPFVARPPYATTDLMAHASIVMPRLLHCCRGRYWDAETREALRSWAKDRTPIVALYVLPTGEVRRLTDGEDPQLRTLVTFLPDIPSPDNLDGALVDILRKLVAGRGTVIRSPLTR
jgi:hypothetical protein